MERLGTATVPTETKIQPEEEIKAKDKQIEEPSASSGDGSQEEEELKASEKEMETESTATAEKEKKKKPKFKSFAINCFAANHAYPLVQEMCKMNPGWHETLSKEKFDMMYIWHTTEMAEIYDILLNKKNKIINRYPGVRDIARKDNTESMMKIAADESPSYDFVPRTFIFPQEEAKFHEYQANNKSAVFIAKPGAGCMGDAIALFQNLRDVPDHTRRDSMVV